MQSNGLALRIMEGPNRIELDDHPIFIIGFESLMLVRLILEGASINQVGRFKLIDLLLRSRFDSSNQSTIHTIFYYITIHERVNTI